MEIRRHQGFTLLELVLVLSILSILASLAVASYQDYMRAARRDDAKYLLLLNAHRLQRCFTLEGVYNGNCVTRPLSEEGYYTLTVTASSKTFLLTALPVEGTSQEKDAQCQSFVYDQTGSRTATGNDADGCWL